MGENDMNDIFLSFCKRLEASHNKDEKEKEDTFKNSSTNKNKLNFNNLKNNN